MKRISLLALLLTAFAGPSAYAQETKAKPAPVKDARLSRETPEGTLRVFTLAVLLANEQLIKLTIVPVSKEEMKYLLQKPEGGQPSAKELKERVASMKVRALKPGDTFTLPGGKQLEITKEDVNDESLVLVLEDAPVPTRLHKARGYWWVDAGPVIAGRKAAAEAKRKRERAQTPAK